MFNIDLRSISLFVIVSIIWYFGFQSLAEIFVNFNSQWYWYVIATVYSVTLNEIFAHQICSHRPYKIDTNKATFKLLTFLTTVDHAWAPISNICRVHENHHLYSDKGINDNLNWRRFWYNVCILSPIMFVYQDRTVYPNSKQFFKKQDALHQDILTNTWVQFCEENRIILTLIFWATLYFLFPVILFNVVFLGRVLFSIFMILAAIGGHVRLPFGYRNFPTNDNTHNNLIFHYLALGLFSTMLHNNHHGTTSDKHSFRWYEIDLGAVVIRMLKPLLEKS